MTLALKLALGQFQSRTCPTRAMHLLTLAVLVSAVCLLNVGATDSGALIRVSAVGKVSVLLSELPASQRPIAMQAALAQDDDFWLARVRRQLALAEYRLVWRAYYHAPYVPNAGYGPLSLPHHSVFDISLGTAVYLKNELEHVVMDYLLTTYIVSDIASPALVDPALGTIGGITTEVRLCL